MVDLRRQITAINVRPSESREKDFNLALADYLYKELKYQGLNVSKRSVVLKIALEKKHLDKYDNIIIDCLEGKLFLRGQEVKDKFFGKLRRFEGKRAADAYYCMAQSTNKIIERINKIINDNFNDDDEREIFGESIEFIDLRKSTIKDLRKPKLDKTASVTIKDLRKKIIRDARTYIRKDLRKTASIVKDDRTYTRKDLRKIASIKDLRKKTVPTIIDMRGKNLMKRLISKADFKLDEIVVIEEEKKNPYSCDSDDKNVYEKWEEFSSNIANHLNRI